MTNENKKKTSNKKIVIEDHDDAVKIDIKQDSHPEEENTASNDAGAKKSKASKSTEATLKEELAQERDKYLRLAAEYKNFRDRNTKERDMIYTNSRIDTVAKLLPIYDNLERALKTECTDEAFYKGVEMTMTQLMEIFESLDVKPIPAKSEPFDPNHHNAVMTIENPELGSKIVAEELQKGFMLSERVIRFSTVVVAN